MMPLSKNIGIALICLITLLGMGIATRDLFRPAAKASTSEPAPIPLPMPAGNLAPTKEWLDTYNDYLAIQSKLKQALKDKGIVDMQDQLTGISTRLSNGIPKGRYFDEATRSFAPVPPAPPSGVPGLNTPVPNTPAVRK